MADDPNHAPPPAPPPRDVEAHTLSQPSTAGMPAHAVPPSPVGDEQRCPRCGAHNPAGVAFCRDCGQRLISAADATMERPSPAREARACPRCGASNPPGAVFCRDCGAALAAPGGSIPTMPAASPASPVFSTFPGETRARRRGAVLGPVVLLIGALGLLTAWLLPFPFGGSSLWERTLGDPGGYGLAFWQGYADAGDDLLGRIYYGLAAPAPVLVIGLLGLAVWGALRAEPGRPQRALLLIGLAWGLSLAALFVLVEVLGGPGGSLLGILRAMSPGGIIFLLGGLIVAIGAATRLARG